ncbi:polymorphic toxin type 37 domain-containing protein [Nocardia sp. R6R-6]|uniref:polymorphic toxin type 37 domain-containing protein n=1 Tax=Nocardia sp. R6R-6 TaxID=3459303 RepID=UPI00403DA0A9
MIIAPQSYYSAANDCYALSKDFQAAYNPVQTVLLETGGMAGSYQAVKVWSKSYDERAGAFALVATNFARALQHFGDVLTAAGYNWECSNYKANRSPNKGAAPTLPRAIPSELPYGANAVVGVASSRTNSRGLESEFPDLYDKVTSRIVGGEIPDGDTDKLERMATAWKNFAADNAVFGARSRLRLIAEGLERGYRADTPQDIPYLAEHLRTLAASAGEIQLAANDLATVTTDHHVALAAMRSDINTQFTTVVVGASVVIAVSVVWIRNPKSVALEGATLETAATAIAGSIGSFFTGLSGITFTTAALVTGGLATIAGLAILIAAIDADDTPYEQLTPAPEVPLGGLTDASEEYIRAKHVEGGAQVTDKKSTFKAGTDLDALADSAEETPARGPNQYGNYERIVDAGEVVGNLSKEAGGAAASRYKVITDKYGTVINMFPVE